MIKGKRGSLARTAVIGAIVAVIVIIITSNFIGDAGKTALASFDLWSCRTSVLTASMPTTFRLLYWDIGPENSFDIDCPKRYVFFREEAIVANDGVVSELEGAREGEEDEDARQAQLKDFILKEMESCWNSFGGVTDRVYTAKVGPDQQLETSETACFACSEIWIEKDFPETTLEDFYNYANKKRGVVSGKSYVESLTGGTDLKSIPEKGLVLEPGQQWSVIFAIKKHKEGSRWVVAEQIDYLKGEDEKLLPKSGSAIVDCYMVGENSEKPGELLPAKSYSGAIGCESGKINGFSFGKVAQGYKKDVLHIAPEDKARYPMTVRFIQTEDIFKKNSDGERQCERLY